MSSFEGVSSRRKMKKFRLIEISAVDRPCQEHATIDGVKSAPIDQEDPMTETVEKLTAELEKKSQALEAAEAKNTELAARIEAADKEIIDQKAARDGDEVIYTSPITNQVFRKSAGDAVIEMAKAYDARLVAEREERAKDAKAAADRELKRRAETELAHLPGSVDAKVAHLRAIDAIEDDTYRDEALRMLKSRTMGLKAVSTELTAGSSDSGEPETKEQAEAKLKELAQKHANEKSVSYEKAYTEICSTPEGARLYNVYVSAAS